MMNGDRMTGPKYWRSLDELAGTPEFKQWVHREFPENATDMLEGESRRTVLKVMAASFGLAGLAACSRPVEHILPNSKGVDNYVPGQSYFYGTAMSLGGHVQGLLVETHDGRPTKIEGNPDHPTSLGAATALAQASILNLYDPDRSRTVLEGGKDSTWAKFEAAAKGLSLGDGSGLRFLSEAVMSPSLASLRAAALQKFPKAKWVEYESFNRENERLGCEIATGTPGYSRARYDNAKVIVSLDLDFLNLDIPAPLATKLFAKRRRVESEEDLEKLTRLYMVESQFSITGSNADHRLRVKGSAIKQFAMDLAAQLGALPGLNVVGNGDRGAKFLAAVVKDLKAAGKEGLVVAGPRQPAVVHAIAHLINSQLGAIGTTVEFPKGWDDGKSLKGAAGLKSLTTEMSNGQVSTLVILGGNPVYTAPADVQFGAALSKVAASIHLGQDADETAAAAKWHVPEAHYLESWGDVATVFGATTIQQPLIEPLHGGKTASEIVALLIDNKEKSAHDIVKAYWTSQWPAADRDKTWKKALHDGLVPTKAADALKVTIDAKKVAAAVAAEPKAADTGVEVAFVPSATAWDGKFSNNGWMQEAPDPMTKLVWGNAALISAKTAAAKNLSDGDVVTLAKGNLKLDVAVRVQPGQADDAVTLGLGYGRMKSGRVGTDVGFNAGLIRTTDDFWYGSGFSITPTGKRHVHASTQEHGAMEGRPIVREATVAEYKKNPKTIEERQELPVLDSLYPQRNYDQGYQWGMAIDLTACTGCNACVVACTAENNIPVVGKEQVLRGREMHWLRLDRYYVGSEDEPRAVEQPLPCMQCENAPCENVCPVAATTHSNEGLNDMVYNRCVGTRYCANNCPFKVRHFNFLNFHKHEEEVMKMVYNPDVTVRMRGVMEKCTYCVQRIQETKIKAKVDGRREIKEGEVQTACQQTCPADAIAFGNINDPNSRVAKLKKQERNYALLADLNIRPRTTYLARLRNPNPELEPQNGEREA